MLLQFTVENVLSFRDETVLSLLAAHLQQRYAERGFTRAAIALQKEDLTL